MKRMAKNQGTHEPLFPLLPASSVPLALRPRLSSPLFSGAFPFTSLSIASILDYSPCYCIWKFRQIFQHLGTSVSSSIKQRKQYPVSRNLCCRTLITVLS